MTFHEGMLRCYGAAKGAVRGLVYAAIVAFGGWVGLSFLLGYSTSVILQKLEKRDDDGVSTNDEMCRKDDINKGESL